LSFTPRRYPQDFADRQHPTTKGTTAIIKPAVQYSATLETTKSKYAFATLLASDALGPDDQDNLHDDSSFIAICLLAYQILHAAETRSKDTLFIVLTTEGVSEAKRERLFRDGAIVLAVETVKN
jgi:alpha-N-acetylglucosamine transferase